MVMGKLKGTVNLTRLHEPVGQNLSIVVVIVLARAFTLLGCIKYISDNLLHAFCVHERREEKRREENPQNKIHPRHGRIFTVFSSVFFCQFLLYQQTQDLLIHFKFFQLTFTRFYLQIKKNIYNFPLNPAINFVCQMISGLLIV